MDIVKFFAEEVSKWNENNKCGMCWEFGAPLFENATNIQQLDETCCTYVFITKISKQKGASYNSQTNLLTSTYTDYSFTLHLVKQGYLGTNNYNEIKGYPIDESRWNTIYKPISECINGLNLDFCNFIGIQPNQITWNEDMEQNYLDNNYFGWRITAKFRINNPN